MRGLEGRAFGGDLQRVCARVCTCVHLAGSYQGLALPDDRYKGGGERDSGGEKKETALASLTHLNTHIQYMAT